MLFQVSDLKGQHFYNLVDNDLKPIELLTAKDRPWLKFFSHLNLLCTKATRAVTNHAPIGKY